MGLVAVDEGHRIFDAVEFVCLSVQGEYDDTGNASAEPFLESVEEVINRLFVGGDKTCAYFVQYFQSSVYNALRCFFKDRVRSVFSKRDIDSFRSKGRDEGFVRKIEDGEPQGSKLFKGPLGEEACEHSAEERIVPAEPFGKRKDCTLNFLGFVS